MTSLTHVGAGSCTGSGVFLVLAFMHVAALLPHHRAALLELPAAADNQRICKQSEYICSRADGQQSAGAQHLSTSMRKQVDIHKSSSTRADRKTGNRHMAPCVCNHDNTEDNALRLRGGLRSEGGTGAGGVARSAARCSSKYIHNKQECINDVSKPMTPQSQASQARHLCT
jgi:hypothetical protein